MLSVGLSLVGTSLLLAALAASVVLERVRAFGGDGRR